MRAPLAARSREAFQLPLRHAGTFLCDPGLLGDGQACPFRAMPLIVPESETVAVDRDVMLLIEEWRLRPDGIAIAPGVDPKDATPLYTLNGKTSFELSAPANERLRLRIINASQRSVLAIKLEGHEVRVMAIDGEPAEPFSARNGALVLAPGGRTDAFIDGRRAPPQSCSTTASRRTRSASSMFPALRCGPRQLPPAPPLPSNGLPAQLDLKNAQRFDVAARRPRPTGSRRSTSRAPPRPSSAPGPAAPWCSH